MGLFWAGVFLGFVASILADYFWEFRGRFRARVNAKKLVGKWTAYNVQGRHVDSIPMAGAGLTEISLNRHRWSPDAHVLDVRSEDISADGKQSRPHGGNLVLDPLFPRLATRIDVY